ncbi:FimV/HubP family polar landmark protein [Pseudomonas sp.]|uniref:FimV/HubP family polar landmark protein n=1 Tax=Pseudomonas sp. TaxID=306 RepID=UPI0028AA755D|nr:FimV/HubP family polar landmark protein [Pseudomonas sp.]
MVRVRNLVLAIAAATALTSEMAYALGLGEVKLKSALNQPLVAEIELLDAKNLAPGEVVPVLASAEDFNRAGVDRQYFLTDLTFTPVLRPDGKSVIRVSSTKPVREPYLNFLIEVLWPSGRLLREYTLLLDPPQYSPEIAASAAPQLPVAAPISRPAAAPRAADRPASAPAARTATGPQGEQYKVTPNDTLWEIAERARQGGTVHQAMLAIQDLNPDAFIGGNINRMKNGQVLRLPTAEQVASRSQAEAIQQVAQQNASWRQAAGAAPGGIRQLDATQRGSAGASPARSEQGDNLRLVAPEAGSAKAGSEAGNGNDAAALRDKLAVSEENLDSSRRENLDLKDRLNDLQGQLDKLQRLMQMKDDQLAELQAQLATDGAPAGESSAPAGETSAVANAEPAAAAPVAASAEGDTDPAEAQVAPEAAPAAEPARAAKPEQKPAAPAAAPVQPEAESPSYLDDLMANPVLLGVLGGSALLLLLVGLMALSRRNAMKEAELQESLLAENSSDTFFVAAHDRDDEHAAAALAEDEREAEPTDSLAAAGSDPLAEADIYIAYGRFNQAADLLHNALNDEPQRSDLRLKLMEVYAELGDREGFARQEAELRDIGGSSAAIEQMRARYPAMAVGAGLGLAVAGAASSSDLDSFSVDDLELDAPSTTPEPLADDAFDLSLDDLELDSELNGPELNNSERNNEVVDASEPAAEQPASELDDFNFDELELETAAAESSIDDFSFDLDEPTKAGDPSFEDELARFSLDLDEQSAASSSVADEGSGRVLSAPLETDAADDFDFGLADAPQPAHMPDEFDLSLDDEAVAPEAAPEVLASELEQVEAELDDLSRNLSEPLDEPIQAPAAAIDPVDPAPETMDEDFDFFADTDETTTKLDLARAYIDMGDAEGARDILDEVMSEGSDTQQQEAREMLAKLA